MKKNLLTAFSKTVLKDLLFLMLLFYHFFNAREGYRTDDMLDAAGILFRNVCRYIENLRQESRQRLVPVQHGSGFFQTVFRQYDPTVGLHDDITVIFQDTHGTGYAGFGKIHFRGDVDRADVAVALLQDQDSFQIIFAGFQKRHNYFLLAVQKDYQ